MKKILPLLLMLALLVSLTGCPAGDGGADDGGAGGDTSKLTEGDVAYEKTDGGVVLTEYEGKDEKVVIPETINGETVTALGESFVGNDSIKEITLPATVTSIQSLEGCNSLKVLEAPGITAPDQITANLPVSLEELRLPALEDTTHFPYLLTDMKLVDMSGSRTIGSFIEGAQEVLVSENIRYYHTYYAENGPFLSEEDGAYAIAITPANAALIYCTHFQSSKVKVNGTEYTYDLSAAPTTADFEGKWQFTAHATKTPVAVVFAFPDSTTAEMTLITEDSADASSDAKFTFRYEIVNGGLTLYYETSDVTTETLLNGLFGTARNGNVWFKYYGDTLATETGSAVVHCQKVS